MSVKSLEPLKYAIIFFAGFHYEFKWIVCGTETQLNNLRNYARSKCVKTRCKPKECCGSYLRINQIYNTDQIRILIKKIIETKGNKDQEMWICS